MEFGILFTSQPNLDVEAYPYRAVHERVTQDIVLAEQLGFDYAWIAEHHISKDYGILPDPLIYIANLATQTSRIRLGTAVMTLPLHHPIRLAENIGFADILTGGRLVLGVGSGYRPYEFEALGVPFERRRELQDEALPMLLELLREHRIEHAGRDFQLSIGGDYELFPHSLQQPHPPLYMAAATEGSMGLAASYGAGLLLSTLPTMSVLANQIGFYLSRCEETPQDRRWNPGFRQIDVARYVYIADSDEAARKESEEGILRHLRSFMHPRTSGYMGTATTGTRAAVAEALSYDELVGETLLHGSPETVTARVQELRDRTGATSLMLHFPPYYGPERTRETCRRFAAEVMPKL